MHNILEIFQNRILLCGVASWFVAQALKVPLYWFVEKELNWKRFFGSGGMPSSHTAFVVSLALMVGFTQGFNTASFAIAFVLACIVMYDATGVRRETGTQATVINQILRDVLIDGKPISDEELKELVGHTPLEVFFGFILGITMGLLFALF